MNKLIPWLIFILFVVSCSNSDSENSIASFNNKETNSLIRFLDQLKYIKSLDTTYVMQYLTRPREMSFSYIDTLGKSGGDFFPNLTLLNEQKDLFYEIGLNKIIRDNKKGFFKVKFSYFRKGAKDINMIIFDVADSGLNNTLVQQLLPSQTEIIYKTKSVFYYRSDAW